MTILIVIAVFAAYAMMSIAGEISDMLKKSESEALRGGGHDNKRSY